MFEKVLMVIAGLCGVGGAALYGIMVVLLYRDGQDLLAGVYAFLVLLALACAIGSWKVYKIL